MKEYPYDILRNLLDILNASTWLFLGWVLYSRAHDQLLTGLALFVGMLWFAKFLNGIARAYIKLTDSELILNFFVFIKKTYKLENISKMIEVTNNYIRIKYIEENYIETNKRIYINYLSKNDRQRFIQDFERLYPVKTS